MNFLNRGVLLLSIFLAAAVSAESVIFDTPEVAGLLEYGELGDPASLDITILASDGEQVIVDLTSQAFFSVAATAYEVKYALNAVLEQAQSLIQPSEGFTPVLTYLQRSAGDTQTVGLSVSIAVPEPGSLALALCGLAMLATWRR